MQTLKQREQAVRKGCQANTPTGTPLACSSVATTLNKDESLEVRLSERSSKTCFNNPGVDQSQQTGRSIKPLVFVRSTKNLPLMPCTPAKAYNLLQKGAAVVVKRLPFTIQLTFTCENVTQPITLGIDPGYTSVGFSCVTLYNELFSGTLELDTKTVKRLVDRSIYRRHRRNRLRYRQPRFLNRAKPKGWLPPSVQRRYDTQLSLIERIKKWLPVTNVILEKANFDIQLLENPDIEGKDYQQGDLYRYQNVKAFLLARERGKCQLCGKPFTAGNGSHVHHVKPRGKTGSNRPKNLAILHKTCHTKVHKLGLKLPAPKTYKQSTFMNIIHNKFQEDLPGLQVTFGYETMVKRRELNLEKTHYNDAFVIAGGCNQVRCSPVTIKQKHKNNRILQRNCKGKKIAIRKQRYSIQPGDLVKVYGKWLRSGGCTCKGNQVYVCGNKKSISKNKIHSIQHVSTLFFV